jgi:drug/metabolite transporter (DMT)-like permease
MNWLYNILVVVVVTIVTVLGDMFLKNATTQTGSRQIISMGLGIGIYILVAFGFFYMYKLMDFSVSGVIYAIMTIVLFVAVGALVYHESINMYEWIGVGLAITSVVLLARFA